MYGFDVDTDMSLAELLGGVVVDYLGYAGIYSKRKGYAAD